MGVPSSSKNPPQMHGQEWNAITSALPGAHILQTWEWGKVKAKFGWQPHYLVWNRANDRIELTIDRSLEGQKNKQPVAAALTLQRNIGIGGFSRRMGVLYVPKGPLLDWNDQALRQQVLKDLVKFAQKQSSIFIKIDPDLEVGVGIPGNDGSHESSPGSQIVGELSSSGWQYSDEQVQFKNTVLIDLDPDEKILLANMKQKARYNVNLASRKGVTVRLGNRTDLSMLYRMYAATSLRDGFTIRNETYYNEVWRTFLRSTQQISFDQPIADVLIAEVEGIPISAVFIFQFASKAWYLYGMSTLAHRDKMPNYLLQWEAIKRLKAANCRIYDLWGAPDEFTEDDPLWGVYRFKEGLGGTVYRYIGAWDFPINRMLYRLYSKTLPGLMDIMRKHGKATTRQAIG